MAFRLTPTNYYSPDRPHISNSQVSDFLKSKDYYYRKHILKNIPQPFTASIRIGSMVDSMLSGLPLRYQVKSLKRDNPELYEEQKNLPEESFCSQHELDEALCHVTSIKSQPCWKWYEDNGTKFQVLLHSDVDDIPVCGMIDALTQTADTVYIDDFKVVGNLKVTTSAKWYWNCVEMGYLRQLAAYAWMYLRMHQEEVRQIVCRHLISTKIQDGLYKVVLFEFAPELLIKHLDIFFSTVGEIQAAHENNNWNDEPVSWDRTFKILEPSHDKTN